ncbi:hypothetical protein [Sorangium sp. So ce887]|uniref:hypothetical protein n=1 Tax=Sorangium sp. So ce887 TaxID=3133324 RepID=UPI003F609E8D
MACGCPVACSNLTSVPEVAGDAALLRDPRDVRSLAAAMRQVAAASERCGAACPPGGRRTC